MLTLQLNMASILYLMNQLRLKRNQKETTRRWKNKRQRMQVISQLRWNQRLVLLTFLCLSPAMLNFTRKLNLTFGPMIAMIGRTRIVSNPKLFESSRKLSLVQI